MARIPSIDTDRLAAEMVTVADRGEKASICIAGKVVATGDSHIINCSCNSIRGTVAKFLRDKLTVVVEPCLTPGK